MGGMGLGEVLGFPQPHRPAKSSALSTVYCAVVQAGCLIRATEWNSVGEKTRRSRWGVPHSGASPGYLGVALPGAGPAS